MTYFVNLSEVDTRAGIQSVLPKDAKYTPNNDHSGPFIGIKNNLRFDIQVSVLSSIREKGDTRQWPLKPGQADFWQRKGSEVVLVSVGSAPGVPRAFLGRSGFTLHINDF